MISILFKKTKKTLKKQQARKNQKKKGRYERIKPLSANPVKWSNTLKQFADFCRRIV